MDELTALIESTGKNRDLIDKMVTLLDRQTDHQLSPHVLLGFLGLFNLLSIMSVIHGDLRADLKEVSGSAECESTNAAGQTAADQLSGLLKSQGNGQLDLTKLLSSIAAKKKISPNLLLSLFSLLGDKTGPAAPPQRGSAIDTPVEKGAEVQEEKTDKKGVDQKQSSELKYDRKRELGERS